MALDLATWKVETLKCDSGAVHYDAPLSHRAAAVHRAALLATSLIRSLHALQATIANTTLHQ